jgi:hydrogenase small subunit
MLIKRRDFLKYCIGSAAALGLDLSVLGTLQKALAADGAGLPKVIWLNGANCTGCTISLANLISDDGPTDVADLLVNYLDVVFHPNLMGAAGDLAVQCLNEAAGGDFILVVDGGIPTAFNGHTCILWTESGHEVTAKEAVLSLSAKASAILCIGTCSSYGGIPAGNPNPTQIKSVSELTGRQTINIPGCPAHPDWIVWTVANLLAGVTPELDDRSRPRQLYKEEIHKNCPKKGLGETKIFGEDNKCLKELGCKGPRTKADCHIRMWNNATNWCIGANAICLGCTESGFPDAFSPFYKIQYGYQDYEKPPVEEPPVTDTDFRITKAEWQEEISELKVDGEGTIGAKVKVSNADTGVLLGALSVDSEGKWKYRQTNPSHVPQNVRAESNAHTLIMSVKDAPETPETNDGDFRITKAEWRADRSELKVDGEGTIGAKVWVSNADKGDLLGILSVQSDGRWKFRRKNPSPVPQNVLAKSGEKSEIKSVKNAPA